MQVFSNWLKQLLNPKTSQMKKNRIFIAVLSALVMLFITSCTKDLRQKIYTMSTYGSQGITGTVTFNEEKDNKSTITINANGLVSGKTYPMHIHNGPVTAPGAVYIDLGTINATGTSATQELNVTNSFDALTGFNGCFVMHNPDTFSTYVLVGNVGSNAQ
jgi:hypothetical protein